MTQTRAARSEPALSARPSAPAAERPSCPERQPEWFLYSGGDVRGPFSAEEMAGFASEGRLLPDLQVTRRDAPDWQPASTDRLLAPLFLRTHGCRHDATPSGTPSTGASTPTPRKAEPAARSTAATATEAADNWQDREGLGPNPGHCGPDAPAESVSASSERTPSRRQGPGVARPAAPPAATESARGVAAAAPHEAGTHLADRDGRVHIGGWAALMSLVVPGAGQLAIGQPARAAVFLLLAVFAWSVGLGWILHIWAGLDARKAAMRMPRQARTRGDGVTGGDGEAGVR